MSKWVPIIDPRSPPPKTSAIRGIGHGSKHNWTWVGQGHHVTHYMCLRCGENFTHRYHVLPDIFIAMRADEIVEKCRRRFKEDPRGGEPGYWGVKPHA